MLPAHQLQGELAIPVHTYMQSCPRYGEASATASSWRANNGGRQRKTECPLLYR